ncbi:MAG: UDP-N-acetylmuramoyl-L-alanine--D-glutamate ligase, partial [Planctomycetota bacterium]|nr:UDP-N-acetylmuramoyl-L-alanine--D-glutamate ligase [Planctomycetota bacterium]
KVWLGGNIGSLCSLQVGRPASGTTIKGVSLTGLENVHQIKSEDIVVLELSSFQLETLSAIKRSPYVSVVTNISPNHLDRHKTMCNYISAKKHILRYQAKDNYAVLNLDDPEVRRWAKECRGKVLYFSSKPHSYNGAFIHPVRNPLPIGNGGRLGRPISNGVHPAKEGQFYIAHQGYSHYICDTSETRLLGDFNKENIISALAVAAIYKVLPAHLRQVIRTFAGVEHRLEFVAEIRGVRYYNDSIATNPSSTISALRAVKGNLHLILGGYDKGLSFNSLSEEIIHRHLDRVKSIILIGATADKIQNALLSADINSVLLNRIVVLRLPAEASAQAGAKTLAEVVLLARTIAKEGETVLFSPACASFDMFRNFAERGNLFKK